MQSTRSCHLAAVWVGGRHWSIMFFETSASVFFGKKWSQKSYAWIGDANSPFLLMAF